MSGHVFISHSEDGKEFARALGAWLNEHGTPAWIPHEVEPGADIAQEVKAGLGGAAAAVIVLTDTPPSPGLRLEWSELLERRAVNPDMPLVSVQLGSQPVPPFLMETPVLESSVGRNDWALLMPEIAANLKQRSARVEDTSRLRERLAFDKRTAHESRDEEQPLRRELAAAEQALDQGHATGDGRLLAELLGRVGVLRLHLGETEAALEPLEIASRILSESPDASRREQLSTAYCLGNALSGVGRDSEAAALLRAAADAAEGEIDRFTSAAIAFRAGQLTEGMGDHRDAQELFERALALTEPLLGPEDPMVVKYRQAEQE